mmetsp:Transcript_32021/g.72135  ORF Transcript_32021/g.72135 Transcript_32021/m.72135 type:complete len:288 (+) Transcript_32021:272-1135(+)
MGSRRSALKAWEEPTLAKTLALATLRASDWPSPGSASRALGESRARALALWTLTSPRHSRRWARAEATACTEAWQRASAGLTGAARAAFFFLAFLPPAAAPPPTPSCCRARHAAGRKTSTRVQAPASQPPDTGASPRASSARPTRSPAAASAFSFEAKATALRRCGASRLARSGTSDAPSSSQKKSQREAAAAGGRPSPLAHALTAAPAAEPPEAAEKVGRSPRPRRGAKLSTTEAAADSEASNVLGGRGGNAAAGAAGPSSTWAADSAFPSESRDELSFARMAWNR